MSNSLVYVPVAYKEGYSMSAQVKTDNKNGADIYLKNAFVALNSVKKHNPDTDVAIVVNFTLSDYYKNLFQSCSITVYEIRFEDYVMPPDFTWSLAFFKIAALKWINNHTDYQYSLQLESDELCISNFDDMWKELDTSILTMFSPFRYGHPVRKKYSDAFNLIHKNSDNPIICKTGAGFIAGRKDALQHFTDFCDETYAVLKENLDNVDKNIGDELYTSLYCAAYPQRVKPANPYIDVYWTENFYFVSTNYTFDPVSILHLPSEKQTGMLFLFDYYIKKGHLPNNKFIFKLMGFPRAKKPFSLRKAMMKAKGKIKSITNKS